MVYWFELTYDEIIIILDFKYIPTKWKVYSIKPDIYRISDINKTLKNILPDNVKINVTIEEKIFKSNLAINQTIVFTSKSFFYTMLGFTQSHSYPLNDKDWFYQSTAGSYKRDNPINITGIDKVHLKADCIQGSIVNGVREPILDSFALDQQPGHKVYKEPRIKLFKKLNNCSLYNITFYLQDDDYKSVDLNGETKLSTCQLITI